jgi:hypothetical protein
MYCVEAQMHSTWLIEAGVYGDEILALAWSLYENRLRRGGQAHFAHRESAK